MKRKKKIYIKTNAKDINGFPLPIAFYEEKIRIKKRKEDTCILKCGKNEVEVFNYNIVEKEER